MFGGDINDALIGRMVETIETGTISNDALTTSISALTSLLVVGLITQALV